MLLQLVVHGLPFAYAWQDLKDLFRPVGGVSTTEIVTDRHSGRSKGWGTVVFDSEADAQKAVEVRWCTTSQTVTLGQAWYLFGVEQ